MQPIYLDFNSTAPLLPEVAAALADAFEAGYANPASQHALGRRAHQVLEDTREEIARLLGANPSDHLLFTSGGTEANNLALFGLTAAIGNRPGRLLISSIEHPSVTAAADALERLGWQIDKLSVDRNGVVRLDHLDELLASAPPPKLVSVMLANNETGVLQPIAEIVRRASAAGVPVHTDASQAIGKIPVNFRALGVSAMTVSPHKFHAPRGIGALLIKHGAQLQPMLHGATQQLGMRPGTESVALPLGFLAALRTWNADRPIHLAQLRDRLESGIRAAYPQTIINGAGAPRLPNTANIAFVGHDRQALFIALDLAGVYCSTGSACSSGSSEPSPTLVAMDLPREIVSSSLRFSLGATTTAAEIDKALARVAQVLNARPAVV